MIVHVLKTFRFAHSGITVTEYKAGEEIDIKDQECLDYAFKYSFAKEKKIDEKPIKKVSKKKARK